MAPDRNTSEGTSMAPEQRPGEDPDYRFSLANERTFLAWIRTALALLAGGVALVSVVPDFGPRWLKHAAGAVLLLLSATLSLMAYRRWRLTEDALRTGQSLPSPRLLRVLSAGLVVVAVAVFALLVL